MADSKLYKKRRNGDEDSKEKKEKKDKKKKAKSSEEETLVVDFPKGAMETRQKDLLCSIAAFLESSGFHRTLSMFRSEAEIENEGPPTSLINLEDLFCRHSKYSEGTAATAIDWSRENGGISRKAEDEKVVDFSEHIHKKKTKEKNENDGGIKAGGINEQGLVDDSISLNVESRELGDAKDLKKFKAAKDSPTEPIDKKKKKKSIPDSNENAETNLSKGTCETAQDTDIIVPKTDMKDEAKKKNKHKISSDAGNGDIKGEDHNMPKEIVDKKIGEVKSSVNSSSALPAEADAQYKAEKKKKKKVASKFTIENGNDEQVKSDSGNANEEKLDNSEKHRKRKRTPVDGPLLAENETVTKKSRHVKVERGEDDKESGSLLNPEKSDSEVGAGDGKKTVKSSKKEFWGHLEANNNLEKNENLEGSSAKSTNKEKRSAEPKTVNAFQRVKIDQVKFADERLQDNSYWALDEKGSGYGARAQEVLGQVRGRDFRHEKTKKKRGSYRGGQIDLQSHSIKFNSDEDE